MLLFAIAYSGVVIFMSCMLTTAPFSAFVGKLEGASRERGAMRSFKEEALADISAENEYDTIQSNAKMTANALLIHAPQVFCVTKDY